jgi:hypothetical protein
MKHLSVLLFLLLLSPLVAAQAATYQNIIVGSFLRQSDADKQRERVESWVKSSPRIEAIRAKHPFNVVSRESGNYFIVAFEPIDSDEVLHELYTLVKPMHQDAFVSTVQSKELLAVYAKGQGDTAKKNTAQSTA